MAKLQEINLTKVDTSAYTDFINKLNANKITIDENTGYSIAPESLLAKQGQLLYNYIEHPENRPKDIPPKELQKILFDAAFKCNFYTDRFDYDRTALMHSITKGDKETTALLIKNSTDEQRSMQDVTGETATSLAIHYAFRDGNKTANLLIENAITTEQFFTQKKYNGTDLTRAMKSNNEEIASLLIKKATTLDQLFSYSSTTSLTALDQAISHYDFVHSKDNALSTEKDKTAIDNTIKLFAEKAIALDGAEKLKKYAKNPIIAMVMEKTSNTIGNVKYSSSEIVANEPSLPPK